jgi:IS30 family transposase
MAGNGAAAALEGFTRQMRRLPAFLRRRPTCDRGLKMACHRNLALRLKIDIRFRDPHAPRRQFLPEGRGPLRLVPA